MSPLLLGQWSAICLFLGCILLTQERLLAHFLAFPPPPLCFFFLYCFEHFFPPIVFCIERVCWRERELAGEQTNLSVTLSLSLNLLLPLPPPSTARSLSKQHRCCCGNDGSLGLAPWTLLLHLHTRTSQIRQTHRRTHVRTRVHRSVVSVSSAFHHQSSVWPAVWGAEYETDKTNRLMSERQACRQKVLKLFLPTEHTNSSLSSLSFLRLHASFVFPVRAVSESLHHCLWCIIVRRLIK